MLDDMSANDPKAYEKFVSNNIKKGSEEMKKSRDEKRIKWKPEASAFQVCWQIKLKLKDEQPESQDKFVLKDQKAQLPKCLKVNINVFQSEKYYKQPFSSKKKQGH